MAIGAGAIAGIVIAVVVIMTAAYFYRAWYNEKYGRKINLSNDGLITGFG
jgi:hypothetical protein